METTMNTTMKKLIGILLALAVLLGFASALADGGMKLADYHCDRDGFSTKIPLNALTDYRDDKGYMGMITYLNVPGFPPYVMAHDLYSVVSSKSYLSYPQATI